MEGFKPLLPWPRQDSPTTLVEYAADQLREAGVADLVVVVGARADEVTARLNRPYLTMVLNARYLEGKASSVRAGVAALDRTVEAIAIIGADQPRPAWLLRRLFEAHLGRRPPVSVPTSGGIWGHPPVFDASMRDQLLAVSDETRGLRPVVRGQYPHVHEVDVGSPIALLNLNEAADYEEGQRLFAADDSSGGGA